MNIPVIFEKLTQRQDLTAAEMTSTMQAIMAGELTSAQVGGLLIGLRSKGETVTEITAAAQVLRSICNPVAITDTELVDIVGTGGDRRNTFNISTVSAFVVAAAGAKVAKHGNRSVSSRCGSADVLEAAGANLALSPTQIIECVKTIGIGFMFAPQHHPAFKHIQSSRRELGIPTLFNLLGPLTNPALVTHNIIGVYEQRWLNPLAQTLRNLGSRHALVIHGEDKLDEISISSPTFISELHHDQIIDYTITPEQFGIKRQNMDSLAVTNAQESLEIIQQVLANKPGPARDIVILNAGAAIYAADQCPKFSEGVELAAATIASGLAYEKFNAFIQFTQEVV